MPITQTSTASVKIRGWILVACGLFLIVMMLGVTITLYPMLTQAGQIGSSDSYFTGTQSQGQEILRLFYAVIAYGVMTLTIGIIYIATGKTRRIASFLMLAGVAGLLYLGKSITTSLGN